MPFTYVHALHFKLNDGHIHGTSACIPHKDSNLSVIS